jgi:hypothetical protein
VFTDGKRRIGTDAAGSGGVYSVTWRTGNLKRGSHHLLATLIDASGRKVTAGRTLRVCR